MSWPPHTHALPLPGLARTPPRAPCHAQMLQGHPSELLRRLPIICLEDAVLHPTLLPVAVWLMAAEVGTPCCDSSGCTLFLRLIIVLFGSGQAVALHHSDNLGLVKRFGIGQASPGMGTPEKKPEDECRDNVLPPPRLGIPLVLCHPLTPTPILLQSKGYQLGSVHAAALCQLVHNLAGEWWWSGVLCACGGRMP